MLVYNPFQHDSRVLKEGRTLHRAGYDVRLVAIAADGLPRQEHREGIRVTRVEGQPRTMRLVEWLRARRAPAAPPGGPAPPGGAREVGVAAHARTLAGRVYGVMAWLRFARAALREACREPTEIVLSHDLNTLPVAALAARRLRARLLYDSHEVFAELPVHGRLARRRWLAVERALLPTGGVDVDEQPWPCRGVRRQPRRPGAAGDRQRAVPGPRSARRRRARPARRDGPRPGAADRALHRWRVPPPPARRPPRGGRRAGRTARW